MRNSLISFLFCILFSVTGLCQEDCCPNTAIYGDDQNNEYSIIKHYEGYNYVMGYSKFNGDYRPTFTKFDEQYNIIYQLTLNYESIMYDFVQTDDDGFFLVGRSLGADDNNSMLIKISSIGNVVFTRFYNILARESFLKVVRHHNPIDPAFPYYISGAASPNTLSDPLTEENVYLYNMNSDGDLKWTKKYNYTQVDQFASSMIPLDNGGIVLLGNALPMTAFALKLDPNGNPIIASKSDGFRYLDGVELNDGKLALAGYKDESNDLAMLFALDENLTVLSATSFGEEFETFYYIKKDNQGNIYVPGAYETDQSVIIKCNVTNNNITLTQSRYFDYGESRFYEPSLDVQGTKVYVADIRKKNPEAFGKKDVILGTFSTNLDEACLKDFNALTFFPNIISETINSVTFENETTPEPSEKIEADIVNFQSKPICILEEDCTNGIDDDGDGLIDFLDPDCQCDGNNIIEHVPNSGFEEHTDCCDFVLDGCVDHWIGIGGTADYVSPECLNEEQFNEYSWQFGVFLDNAGINFGGDGNFVESFGACLLEPLQSGESYNLSLDLIKNNVLDFNNEEPIPGKINIYGWSDCDAFKTYAQLGETCFDGTSASDAELIYSIDLSMMNSSEWHTYSSTITPTNNVAAISIQMDCVNDPIVASTVVFFFLDNLSITGGWDYQDTIVIKDDLCDETFYLAVKDSADLKYQWYKDGEPILDADSSAYFFDKSVESEGGLFQVVIFNSDSCFITEEYQLEYRESKTTELNKLICPGDSIYFGGKWRFNAGFYTDNLTAANGCDSTVTLNLGFDTNPDCAAEEDCTNGVDDDGDGLIDYLDPDCQCEGNNVLEYVPNPGFEDHTGCCPLINDGCVDHWIGLGGSSDYVSEECLDADVYDFYKTNFGESLTSTCVHFGGIENAIEAFGTCLTQPLIAGQEYYFSLDMLENDVLDATNEDIISGKINVYGWVDCESFKTYSNLKRNCFDENEAPNAELLYSMDLSEAKQFEWHTYLAKITPTNNINAISIQPDCVKDPIAAVTMPPVLIFLMDNISIKSQDDVVTLPEYDINVEGSFCDDSFLLVTKDSSDYNYQWYKENEILVGAEEASFMFDKSVGHTGGLYQVVIITPEGCSIVDSIDIPVQNNIVEEITKSICSGDSVSFEGEWFFDAGDYMVTLQTSEGCDSTRILHLEIGNDITKNVEYTICPDETLTIGGEELKEAGVYDVNVPGVNSCDTLYTVTLNVFPKTNVKESAIICEGEKHTFQGIEFDKEGTYFIDYENQYGCMTIDTLILTVNPIFTENEEQTICAGDTFFYKGTIPLFEEDLYTFNEQTVGGCDSTVNIEITLIEESSTSEEVTICQGETYTYNGVDYTEKGTYPVTFQSIHGCDSIHTITLEVVDTVKTFEVQMLCSGESYMIDGEELTTSGLYQYYYKSQAGCDSVFAIELSFIDLKETEEEVEICDNEYFVQDNDTLRVDGIYEYTYPAITGCDSTHTIELKVYDTHDGSTEEVEIKEGEYYVFGGDTLYQEGNYSHIYNTANGCDSIEYLELRVKRIKNDVFVPNIFSPNNDGVNDRFQIYANGDLGMEILELSIYDRWGNRIFQEKNLDENWTGWDGRFKGSKVVAGVYVYILKYKGFSGVEYRKSGSITVLN